MVKKSVKSAGFDKNYGLPDYKKPPKKMVADAKAERARRKACHGKLVHLRSGWVHEVTTKKADKPRRPHYECNHKTTICRDCDGSLPATNPWRTFVLSEEV